MRTLSGLLLADAIRKLGRSVSSCWIRRKAPKCLSTAIDCWWMVSHPELGPVREAVSHCQDQPYSEVRQPG
jgi:hypothetical protein